MSSFLSRIKLYIKPELLLVFLVWVIALFLRLYQLDKLLPFTFDQGRDLLELSKIITGDITLIGPTTGIAGLYLGPFYFYALLPGFLLGNGSPVFLAYWVAFCASLSLPLVFYTVKKISSSVPAWISYLIMVFLPGSLQEARVIWNPTFAVPLLIGSWWCLFSSKKAPWLLIPSLLLYGLALQTELAYVIFLGPAYLWWIAKHSGLFTLLPWHKKISNKPLYSWKNIILAFLAAALTLLPQLLFEVKHGFVMFNSALAASTNSDQVVPYAVIWDERPRVIAQTLQSLLFAGNVTSRYIFIGLLIALGMLKSFWKKPEHLFLLLATWLPIAGMMLFRGNNGRFFDYYLNPHYLPIVMLLGLSYSFFKSQVARSFYLALLVIMFFAAFWRTAHVIYNPEAFAFSYQKQTAAFNYALHQTPSVPATIELFVPNLKPDQYKYYNSWYARENNTIPAQINNNETSDKHVILLYEPAFKGGSLSAFRSWYKEQKQNTTCQEPVIFGIISVETCYKQSN